MNGHDVAAPERVWILGVVLESLEHLSVGGQLKETMLNRGHPEVSLLILEDVAHRAPLQQRALWT